MEISIQALVYVCGGTMKLEFKQFYYIGIARYRVVKQELYPKHKKRRMCLNCRKMVYNKLTRAEFCSRHKTTIDWYNICAYFNPGWYKKL